MTQEALKLEREMKQLREVHAVQGRDGCWDIDDYMLGMFNGLELALCIMESRPPQYKERKALAQPEQKPVGDDWTPCMKLPVVVYVRKQRLGESHVSTREGITPVKPDDLIMRGVSGEEYPIGRAIFEQTYSLNTAPPQRTEQEPVAWRVSPRYEDSDGYFDFTDSKDTADTLQKRGWTITPLYTTPPQRTWVGLTDEEIWKFWWSRPEVPEGEDDSMEAEFVAAVRAVLAAHGIKENT